MVYRNSSHQKTVWKLFGLVCLISIVTLSRFSSVVLIRLDSNKSLNEKSSFEYPQKENRINNSELENIQKQLPMKRQANGHIVELSTKPVVRDEKLLKAKSKPSDTNAISLKSASEIVENVTVSFENLSSTNASENTGFTEEDRKYLEECLRPRPMIQADHDLGPPPKPWIHLGLPKSGTTSLEQFWKCGGVHTSHSVCKVTKQFLIQNVFKGRGGGYADGRECSSKYIRPCKLCATCMKAAQESKLPILESCGNYSALAQLDMMGNKFCYWPQLSALEEIHQEAPTATFVVMFRNVTTWIRSFKKFKYGDMYNAFVGPQCQDMPFNKGDNSPEALTRFYCNVVQNARNFVALHPSHRLVEIDLDDPETSVKVANVFGINVSCWGTHNVNKKILKQLQQEQANAENVTLDI